MPDRTGKLGVRAPVARHLTLGVTLHHHEQWLRSSLTLLHVGTGACPAQEIAILTQRNQLAGVRGLHLVHRGSRRPLVLRCPQPDIAQKLGVSQRTVYRWTARAR